MYSVVGTDGQVYGPVDMATLSQWIAEGRIVESTNLIDPLDGRVIQAGQAPALMGRFPQAAPPMPNPGPAYGPMNMGPQHHPHAYGYPRPDMMHYAGPPKSKVVGMVLAFFLGFLGIHRFYLGHTGTGVAMLLISVFSCAFGGTIITGIWAIVDLILIATGALRERNGRALV